MDRQTLEYILNLLRRGTVEWKDRTLCLNRDRRQRAVGEYKNGKQKFLWERRCDGCGEWFLLKDNVLEVDHIVEVGPYKGDLHEWIERLYCGQENLQALCIPCHDHKTSGFNSRLRYERKVKNDNRYEDL